MQIVADVRLIVQDQIRPFRIAAGNVWNPVHAALHFAAPAAGAAGLATFASAFAASNATELMAAYGLVATALTAVVSTIHSLTSSVNAARIDELRREKPNEPRMREAMAMISRIEIIRGLFASIGWSIIVLIASIVPLLCLTVDVFEAAKLEAWQSSLRWVLAFLSYFAGITAGICFLDIIGGVHLMMVDQTGELEDALADLKKKYQL